MCPFYTLSIMHVTQEVIFLAGRVPCYSRDPVICHTVDHLAAVAVSKHGQVLQQKAQLTHSHTHTRTHDWTERSKDLSEVQIMLKSQSDVSIDVNLLFSINVLWTHLPPRNGTLPWELQSL